MAGRTIECFSGGLLFTWLGGFSSSVIYCSQMKVVQMKVYVLMIDRVQPVTPSGLGWLHLVLKA